MERWTFLTNYGHVLLCIAGEPDVRLKDVAARVGITERSAQRIVADLIAEGYLKHARVGRRNRYEICSAMPLRHPVEKANQVGLLVRLLGRPAPTGAPRSSTKARSRAPEPATAKTGPARRRASKPRRKA